jgi:hypothetical protein
MYLCGIPYCELCGQKTSNLKHIGIIAIQMLFFSHRTHSFTFLKNLSVYVVFPIVNYVVKKLRRLNT